MTSRRLEGFSDGVFSIAATLLVLQLRVPTPAEGDIGLALLSQWPSYVAYILSFLTIGTIWVNHHALFATVRRVDRTLLFLNLFLLLCVSAIPFPAALLGRYIGGSAGPPSQVAAAVFGGVMALLALTFVGLRVHVLRNPRLIVAGLDPERARANSRVFSVGLLAYVLGIGLAFVSPEGSLILYAFVGVCYIFIFRRFIEDPEAPEA